VADFVLGTVQLGLAYGAANRTGKPNPSQAVALLRRAVAAGVGCFDTARAYGDSEDRLGEALSAAPVFIVTKLSPLGELSGNAADSEVVAAVEGSVTRSLAALRKDRLDCLLLHRATHLHQFGGAVWRRLQAYAAVGTIAKLGVSVQSPAEVEMALDCADVCHLQMPFNLLDRRWRRIIPRLRQRPDVTVHVRSVLLQGLLAVSDPAVWPPIPGVDAAAVLAEIARLVKDLNRESAADLCLAYARGQDFIDGVVIGLETETQLDDNLRLAARPPLNPSECDMVEARLPLMPEQLLNPALWPKT